MYSFGVLAWELAFYLYAGRYQVRSSPSLPLPVAAASAGSLRGEGGPPLQNLCDTAEPVPLETGEDGGTDAPFAALAGRRKVPFGDGPGAPDGQPGGCEAGYAAGEFDSYLDRTEFNDLSDAGGAFGRAGPPIGTASASPRRAAPHPGASTQGQRELLASLSGRFRRLSATSPPLGPGGAASPLSGVPAAGPGLQVRPAPTNCKAFERVG